MTREEKQKTIDALKISAPVIVMTREEFKDYIQTLNKIMDWLEQEPVEKPYIKGDYYDGFKNGLQTAEWRYNKIRAEIEQKLNTHGYISLYNKAINDVLEIIDEYKAESKNKDDN